MAKQVFLGNPLNYSYVIIDNSAAGNFGNDNFTPPSSTAIAGANGYDITWPGATFQGLNAVSGANGSIPDFAVSPTKVLTDPARATITYKNPA